ncbi:unnamed protein product [Rhizophagus irregularis]|nr:unnamed protein product [Rhizophagus irregularis]
MKKELIENFELQVEKCEKARLRHIISNLLGDFSTSENSISHKVDERVDIMIELEEAEKEERCDKEEDEKEERCDREEEGKEKFCS